ncbi:uncharacterized protein LOC110988267 isoform X2 [Acanthaster planci]|nr:uncharacterized protein LOC110988267 isoform X2 [Acanthaster planci]XP_022107306.1 uncharacterized protein LOC110988267 isoform X2 [Acanthaster planci]
METSVCDYNIIDLKDISFDAEISTTGSRNKVYRATWQKSRKQKVAAKCCQRFHEEEVLILARMNHDNIIKFLGVVKPTSVLENYFIVTEYAEGGSLYDVISQHREDWPEFRQSRWMRWAQDGAKALQYIHEKKYQHGDVKSPNFLVTSDETLKICDFGISRQCDYTVSTVTNRGSSPWMAPEAFGDVMYDSSSTRKPCKVTTKSDVYSFGVVMWELISGEAPYSNKMPMQILTAVVINKDRLEIPHDSPEHQQMSDLLNKCWQADYTQRPSIQEVLQSLIDIDNGCKKILGKRTPDTEENDSAQPPSKKVTTGILQQQQPIMPFSVLLNKQHLKVESPWSMRENTELIPLSKLCRIATLIQHHWKVIACHVQEEETLEVDLKAIRENHVKPAKEALQMLFQWRERWPNVMCTWGRLYNALFDLNLETIAEKCNQVHMTYKHEGSPQLQEKVKLLSGEEPAFIPVGTNVLAKYRGTFCDANVINIKKSVRCMISFLSDFADTVVSDDHIRGYLKVGAVVEARHPVTDEWMDGMITKLTDASMYTVVYDDGDEKTLGRSSLRLHDRQLINEHEMDRKELPFLPRGTEVKVMYRGALCDAKVETIKKSVKCKINFFGGISGVQVSDNFIKGDLQVKAVVEARHPVTEDWMDGVIMKVTDDSTYTVVFDDGDEETLKRSSLFL